MTSRRGAAALLLSLAVTIAGCAQPEPVAPPPRRRAVRRAARPTSPAAVRDRSANPEPGGAVIEITPGGGDERSPNLGGQRWRAGEEPPL